MYRRAPCYLLMAVSLAACGSKSGTSDARPKPVKVTERTLAVIGDRQITVDDLEKTINSMSLAMRRRHSARPDLRKKMLEQQVKEQILANEARRRGVDRSAALRRQIRHLLALEMERRLEREFVKKAIPDKRVREYYERHKSDYRVRLRLRARQIVVKSKSLAERLAKEATRSPTEAAFRALVKRHSIDALTKGQGGDLGFFSDKSNIVPAPVFLAALSLKKPGQISRPVQSSLGWHVLRLTSRRDERQRPLEAVREQIRSLLGRSRAKEAFAPMLSRLRKKNAVKLFFERLNKIKIDLKRRPHETY